MILIFNFNFQVDGDIYPYLDLLNNKKIVQTFDISVNVKGAKQADHTRYRS